MGRRRVAERDEDFDAYIKNTSKMLESGSPIGSVRLGLSNNEKIEWLAYRDEWTVVYPKYTNVTLRTKAIKEHKNDLKKRFTQFAGRPLGKIALSNNITTDDRVIFNVPARSTARRHRGAMDADRPFGWGQIMGGGFIKMRVRISGTEGRPSKHKLADAVEMKYMFWEVEKNFIDLKVNVDDCTQNFISKKASFIFDAGQKNLGKRMLAFVRWVNFSNPSHNSGWSQMINVVVG